MDERPEMELMSIPTTPRVSTPEILTPTGQRSPRSIRLGGVSKDQTKSSWTPTSLISPRFLSPIGTPMKRVIVNMKGYLEVGHITKLNPQDAWLPITESRNGNAHYAAFHNLNDGIGFQALLLPVAFSYLGWSWGIIALTIAYFWQLYTLWVLVQLHEAVPGKRYNRYVELAQAAFGERLGVWLALFPTVYLSAGTGTALILIGGETMKLFFQIVCGPACTSNPLTTVEWYLVFTSLSTVLSQLPNLNSIAGLSLVGAIIAIVYCTIVWVLSVTQMRPPSISYQPISSPTVTASTFSIFNVLGVIAFAFRGHNLVLEIQAEKVFNQDLYFKKTSKYVGETMSHLESIASSAVRAAITTKASVIIVFTSTGKAARLIAKYRPTMPVISVVVPRLITNQLKWTLPALLR